MTNGNHVPKRRFKEFESNGEWEETKLRELFQYIGNAFVGTATPYYVESGHFYLESNNIKDGQINYNTEVFINDEFYQKQKNKWLQTGDMVMVQSGHVGHAAVIPENLNNSAAHALIMFRNPSENLESHFLNYQYQTTKAKEKIKTITTGNTIQHILASDMKEYKVYISNIKEQLKIGKFFQTIDSLISNHQHKLDKLKNLKKAYLSEMFPAEGERVPKRRFLGFEDEWEEKKLSEVVKEFIVPMRDKPKEFSGNIPWTRIDDIEGKYISRSLKGHCVSLETVKRMNLKIIPEDSLIVSASATFGTVAIVKNDLITNQTFIGLVPKNKYEVEFLFYLFQSPKVRNYMKEESAGSTIFYISRESFEKMEIDLPDENERKLISKHLRTVDSLITLQQQKLDKLNDLKKAYLNELFV